MFRTGLVQMRVEPGDVDANLRRAESLVRRAAEGGARVVVLPEAMDCGWTHASSRAAAGHVPGGLTYETLARVAREHRVYLCSGLTERAGDRVYNAAVLISPGGTLLLRHRKINELDIAHDVYDPGDRIGVVRTPLATFGLMICADGFAPGHAVSRSLGLMGADIILSPSAWAVVADHDNGATPYGKEWQDCYAPVAREFGLWVVGVSNVGPVAGGPWGGRRCIGCSLAVGPDGETVMRGPYGEDAEEVMFLDVTPHRRRVRGSTWAEAGSQRDGHRPVDGPTLAL
jgi:predicted amidohydrolase